VTFTNLKCGTKDRKFATFEKCYIKAVNRTHKYIDIHVNLLKVPVNNITEKRKEYKKVHKISAANGRQGEQKKLAQTAIPIPINAPLPKVQRLEKSGLYIPVHGI